MEHFTEIAIISTNVLVFLATVALAVVTAADVVKDGNRTVRDALKALVKVSLAKVGTSPDMGSNVTDEQLEKVAKQIEEELEHRHHDHEEDNA